MITLSLEELLEVRLDVLASLGGKPPSAQLEKAYESLRKAAKDLGTELASFYQLDAHAAVPAEEDIDSLEIGFTPTRKGQRCPALLRQFDPGGDWGFKNLKKHVEKSKRKDSGVSPGAS